MGLVRNMIWYHIGLLIVFATPFVMERDKFENILSFFHLCDNTTYPKNCEDGYDACKKLGKLFTSLTFTELWIPHQNLLIDKGCIAFKGRASFKCYNAKKIDKYHIKS